MLLFLLNLHYTIIIIFTIPAESRPKHAQSTYQVDQATSARKSITVNTVGGEREGDREGDREGEVALPSEQRVNSCGTKVVLVFIMHIGLN